MTDSTRGPGSETVVTEETLRRLFADLAAGRVGALEQLWACCADEIYGLAVWRTGSTADAADVVQDVFVRLAGSGKRLSAVRDPLSYLRRMTHHAAVDVHRQRSRRAEAPLEECAFLEAASELAERRADAVRASRLLAGLPAAQREAIFLRHYAGCSFAEIGRATGAATFTAASRYRLGMRRLRRLLGVKP